MLLSKSPNHGINLRVILVVLVLTFLFSAISKGERLPIKTYNVGDGLAHNNINKIFQDAKGFLWIATAEGLSRFDGYDFINYGIEDGLGQIFVNDIAVDREGILWIATNGGGISRLIDEPEENTTSAKRKKFVSFAIEVGGESNKANFVNRLLFDAENRLWCLTDGGLYRAKQTEVAERDFEQVATAPVLISTNAALVDSSGRLWFNLNGQVIEFSGDKRFDYEPFREINKTAYQTSKFLNIESFTEDKRGRIFASDPQNVYEFIEPKTESEHGSWRKLPIELRGTQVIKTTAPAANGSLWIGATAGLINFSDARQTIYTTENGLSVNTVNTVLTDLEGNVWIGTHSGGLNKLAVASVVSYTIAEGLPSSDVYRFTADNIGEIYAQVGCVNQDIAQISGEKINIIPQAEFRSDYCNQPHFLQDAQRRWWILTAVGLWISDTSALDLTKGHLLKDALPTFSTTTAIYQDAEGKIWLINYNSGDLYMTDAKLPGIPQFQLIAQNVPAERIIRDSSGTLWLASRNNLWRIKNGKVSEIRSIENLPRIEPRSLFQDSRGRVWIGTRYNGAIVTNEPEAENPSFKTYTIADGLASSTIWTISEDNDGLIYLGTGRGVDQLDTATGKIKHFTNDDGIVGSVINHLFKDAHGNIWVASDLGISRINPRIAQAKPKPPLIFINRVVVAGEEFPLAETGVSDLSVPDLSANQNNITINFIGLSFRHEHALRYQYKLEGIDADWTQAGEMREVNYANIGAGHYRFLVSAINEAGTASEQPATFEFQILSPVWQRWWFIAGLLMFAALVIYGFYRLRLSRLLEVANMRTRIATDLHDDIGANLTKIAILSEVANQQLGHKLSANGKENDNLLGSVAEISRESVSAMGDIVWAINPKKDSLIGLTRRMRQYAEEILQRRNIGLEFVAPIVEPDLKLDANIRRNIYLIFKESINNIVRHSNAAAVKIDFVYEHTELLLKISDDGEGFNVERGYDGNGLINIERRASDCKGSLEIDSSEGAGTRITLRIKLKLAFRNWH